MKVVFDTDPGIDDAMALLYLHACPSLQLLGITTVLGNASIDQCTINACVLCDRFGIDSPVYRGAGAALDGTVGDYPDFVHGTNGLGDVPLDPPRTQPGDRPASQYLCEIAREHPGEITVLAVGRLTNLALAIEQDDSFARNIAGLVIMGGAVEEPGNVTEWAEANIIGDPEAASIVFRSGIPVTLVGLDVTIKTRLSPAYLTELTAPLGELGQFLQDINRCYASYNLERYGSPAFPVHDSSAVGCADQPGLFHMKRGTLSCVLDGEQRGRTLFTEGDGPHKVCTRVNSGALLNRYREVVLAHYSA